MSVTILPDDSILQQLRERWRKRPREVHLAKQVAERMTALGLATDSFRLDLLTRQGAITAESLTYGRRLNKKFLQEWGYWLDELLPIEQPIPF